MFLIIVPMPGTTLSSEVASLLRMDSESLVTMDSGPELGFDLAEVASCEPEPVSCAFWCIDPVRARLKSVEENGVKEANEVDDLLVVCVVSLV
jgi:hypothetical protein